MCREEWKVVAQFRDSLSRHNLKEKSEFVVDINLITGYLYCDN